MGGDDLGSDDEYLNPSISNADVIDVIDDDDDDDDDDNDDDEALRESSNKRKRSDEKRAEISTSKKKNKDMIEKIDPINPSGRKKLLLHTARGIGQESPDVQAAFLWTCYTHALGASDTAIIGDKFQPSSFISWGDRIKLSQGILTNEERDAKYPFIIKEAVSTTSSMKRLKAWNVKKSPMILIACVSARRCVAVLKAISSLKVRCAKLFAKHMDLQQQISQLSSTPFPIAVGTPNRILKLCEDEALNLDSTEFVFIDGHEDAKAFTVCTLNDTAPELARLIQKQVQLQLKERFDKIKLVIC